MSQHHRPLNETDLQNVFLQLGVPLNTSPTVMNRLLTEYQLSTFQSETHPFFADFLLRAKTQSLDLRPLIVAVSKGILANKVLSEFISSSLNWLTPHYLGHEFAPPPEEFRSFWKILSHTVTDLVHTLLILEMCTVSMLNSSAFLKEIFFHLTSVRAKFGISSNSLQRFAQIAQLTGSFFALKVQSIEPAMVIKSFLREHGGTISAEHVAEIIAMHPELNFLDVMMLKSCIGQNTVEPYNSLWAMNINIEEAMMTEKANSTLISGIDNAAAGFALVQRLTSSSIRTYYSRIEDSGPILPCFVDLSTYAHYTKRTQIHDLVRQNDVAYKAEFPKDWIDLYMSWNLAFVVKNVLFAELTVAKLLIPSTLCAREENWLDARVYSLWLVTSFYLSMHKTGNINLSTKMPEKIPLALQQQLIPAFGRINKKHGGKLLYDFLGWDQNNYEQQLSTLKEDGWNGWYHSMRMVLRTFYSGHPVGETTFESIDLLSTWIKIARSNFASIIVRDNKAICSSSLSFIQRIYYTQQYRAEIEHAWGAFLATIATHGRNGGACVLTTAVNLLSTFAYRSPLTSQLVRQVLESVL